MRGLFDKSVVEAAEVKAAPPLAGEAISTALMG